MVSKGGEKADFVFSRDPAAAVHDSGNVHDGHDEHDVRIVG
jgi:hypothetical protein